MECNETNLKVNFSMKWNDVGNERIEMNIKVLTIWLHAFTSI